MTFEVTLPENRDLYFSLQQFVASVLRILTMPLSSGIITFFRSAGSPDRGYYILFAVTLGLYLSLFFETFAFRVENRHAPFKIWEALRDHCRRGMRPVLLAYFIWGLRNGLFWFLMGVLIYRASNKELAVGAYDMLSQGIMLAMTYWLSRLATQKNRARGLGLSAWLDVAGVSLLAWRLDSHTLLLFTVVAAISGALFQVTFSSYSFDIMEFACGGEKRTLENLTVREIPLNLGRIVGLVIFMMSCSHFGETGLRVSVLVLGSAHVGVWWILTHWRPSQA
jgi:YQGE family putative transporter